MHELTPKMLQFLANDETALSQFLDQTGLDPSQLRDLATSHELQNGLLEFFMQNESLLLNFCAHHDVDIIELQRENARNNQFFQSV